MGYREATISQLEGPQYSLILRHESSPALDISNNAQVLCTFALFTGLNTENAPTLAGFELEAGLGREYTSLGPGSRGPDAEGCLGLVLNTKAFHGHM